MFLIVNNDPQAFSLIFEFLKVFSDLLLGINYQTFLFIAILIIIIRLEASLLSGRLDIIKFIVMVVIFSLIQIPVQNVKIIKSSDYIEGNFSQAINTSYKISIINGLIISVFQNIEYMIKKLIKIQSQLYSNNDNNVYEAMQNNLKMFEQSFLSLSPEKQKLFSQFSAIFIEDLEKYKVTHPTDEDLNNKNIFYLLNKIYEQSTEKVVFCPPLVEVRRKRYNEVLYGEIEYNAGDFYKQVLYPLIIQNIKDNLKKQFGEEEFSKRMQMLNSYVDIIKTATGSSKIISSVEDLLVASSIINSMGLFKTTSLEQNFFIQTSLQEKLKSAKAEYKITKFLSSSMRDIYILFLLLLSPLMCYFVLFQRTIPFYIRYLMSFLGYYVWIILINVVDLIISIMVEGETQKNIGFIMLGLNKNITEQLSSTYSVYSYIFITTYMSLLGIVMWLFNGTFASVGINNLNVIFGRFGVDSALAVKRNYNFDNISFNTTSINNTSINTVSIGNYSRGTRSYGGMTGEELKYAREAYKNSGANVLELSNARSDAQFARNFLALQSGVGMRATFGGLSSYDNIGSYLTTNQKLGFIEGSTNKIRFGHEVSSVKTLANVLTESLISVLPAQGTGRRRVDRNSDFSVETGLNLGVAKVSASTQKNYGKTDSLNIDMLFLDTQKIILELANNPGWGNLTNSEKSRLLIHKIFESDTLIRALEERYFLPTGFFVDTLKQSLGKQLETKEEINEIVNNLNKLIKIKDNDKEIDIFDALEKYGKTEVDIQSLAMDFAREVVKQGWLIKPLTKENILKQIGFSDDEVIELRNKKEEEVLSKISDKFCVFYKDKYKFFKDFDVDEVNSFASDLTDPVFLKNLSIAVRNKVGEKFFEEVATGEKKFEFNGNIIELIREAYYTTYEMDVTYEQIERVLKLAGVQLNNLNNKETIMGLLDYLKPEKFAERIQKSREAMAFVNLAVNNVNFVKNYIEREKILNSVSPTEFTIKGKLGDYLNIVVEDIIDQTKKVNKKTKEIIEEGLLPDKQLETPEEKAKKIPRREKSSQSKQKANKNKRQKEQKNEYLS